MKQYVRPEVEIQIFCTEAVMLNTFDLATSNVEGGFGERT